MSSSASVNGLSWLLRHLPGPLIAALDRWSYRIALQRAERRRQPAQPAK
jgi:hypothetical protein